MKLLLTVCATLLAGLQAHAAVETKAIEYKIGDQVFEGFLAFDAATEKARPGVLIVHQWKGLGDYEKRRAAMVAELGYVAFCADIYGKGVRPSEVKEASAMAGKYKDDRALYRIHLNAALDVLAAQPQVDKRALAAMGYCFGGTGALEVARGGADVRGVISFHGGLGTPTPADARDIKGRVLVLHGADDPFVPPAEVDAFKKEMADASVSYEFVAYPGAVHSFTHWTAGSDTSTGAAYDQEADEKSWHAMKAFLAHVFAP